MEVGKLTHNTQSEKTILRKCQILQLTAIGLTGAQIHDLFDSDIRVWNNNGGSIVPPMKVAQLAVLNGDEYPIQMSYSQASGGGSSTYNVVITFEVCDEGSLNYPIYVWYDNKISNKDVTLSSVCPTSTTAVKIRTYNFINIVSPQSLPKKSICILPLSGISQIQKNNDVMALGEMLTHSNVILREGSMNEIHPVLYDALLTTPAIAPNAVYQEIMSGFAMGYGSTSSSNIIIVTGNDDFVVYPNSSCNVCLCTKSLTEIAKVVEEQLAVSGQTNNVDSVEFSNAVAAVGIQAEKQNLKPNQTAFIASKVVNNLPSTKIGKALGISNSNLQVAQITTSGLRKTL